jgi:endoglucanase
VRTGQAAPATLTAADRFLGRYVTSDGRVIRQNQGGDIVSQGQAYAMLIAELAGRPALARTVWSWTAESLGNSDGLFASHANGSGRVEDPHSATDADILIAYALLRYAGPGQSVLRREGRRIVAGLTDGGRRLPPDWRSCAATGSSRSRTQARRPPEPG